jgi:predicted DNA-binding transcriptional regulator AlpA
MNQESNSGADLRQTAPPAAVVQAAALPSIALSASQDHARAVAALGFPVLLSDVQAAACLGVSVRTFHTLRHEPWMPLPIQLGPRLLRWPRTELEQAVASMPRKQKTAEPAQLLRARIERAKATGDLS